MTAFVANASVLAIETNMQSATHYVGCKWLTHVSGDQRFGEAFSAAGERAAHFCAGGSAEARAAIVFTLPAFAVKSWKHSPCFRFNSDYWLFSRAETGGFRNGLHGRLLGAKGAMISCRPNTSTARPTHESA